MNSSNEYSEYSGLDGKAIEDINKEETNDVKTSSKKKKLSKFKKKKIILLSILAVLVGLLIYLGIFIYRTVYDPISVFERPGTVDANNKPVDGQNQVSNVNSKTKNNVVNFLVMGMDIDEERAQTVRKDFRADTILLVSVDLTDKKVNMITVPRDSYAFVKNAAGEFFKINSMVYFGGGIKDSGFKNACDTISTLLGGIDIPYYVTVDMPGLKDLVDTIGGVYYDVDINYPESKTGPRLKKGYQKLNGEQVLTYCRVRKQIGTDLDRQGRQFKMIMAILKQLKSTDQLANFPQIYKSVEDMVYTNLSFEQICALTAFATNIDLDKSISRYALEGSYGYVEGHKMYLIDQKKKVGLVKKIFGIDIPIDEKHDLNYILEHGGKIIKDDDNNEK